MLSVPQHKPASSNAGPSGKRGHRHKRSLAISGDFEFLKRDPTIDDTFSPGSPEQTFGQLDGVKSPSKIQFKDDPILTGDEFHRNLPTTMNSPSHRSQVCTSPRFFITEEPKFSGCFKDVPDAIINLDDILKTKPTSFKNHRRTESAPADLQLTFNLARKLNLTEEQVTEEEEEEEELLELDEIEDGQDCANETLHMNATGNSSTESFVDREVAGALHPNPTILMSPLRAKCPSPNPAKDSPSKASAYNALKINKQKERYYNYYSKQIPSNGSGSSSIPHQSSALSLSSESTISNRQLSTPNTPVSASHGHGRKITPKTKPFKYETQVYDIPPNDIDEEKPRRSTISSIESPKILPEKGTRSRPQSLNATPQFTEDILLGQPGESVDPSQLDAVERVNPAAIPENRKISPCSASSRGMRKRTEVQQAVQPSASLPTEKKKLSRRFHLLSSLFSKPKR